MYYLGKKPKRGENKCERAAASRQIDMAEQIERI